MADGQGIEPAPKGFMIGAVDLFDPPFQLGPVDRAPPQPPVPECARGDEAKAVAGSGADRRRRYPLNRGWIDLFLVPVAVDDGARHLLDYRADPGADGPPGETVDERVFKRFQRSAALGGVGKQRLVIIPSRMRHGQ